MMASAERLYAIECPSVELVIFVFILVVTAAVLVVLHHARVRECTLSRGGAVAKADVSATDWLLGE